jgi:hypothetical protein
MDLEQHCQQEFTRAREAAAKAWYNTIPLHRPASTFVPRYVLCRNFVFVLTDNVLSSKWCLQVSHKNLLKSRQRFHCVMMNVPLISLACFPLLKPISQIVNMCLHAGARGCSGQQGQHYHRRQGGIKVRLLLFKKLLFKELLFVSSQGATQRS